MDCSEQLQTRAVALKIVNYLSSDYPKSMLYNIIEMFLRTFFRVT